VIEDEPMKPVLFAFDIFGTVLDWRRGLRESLARRDFELGDKFDAVIDRQAKLEAEGYARYAVITARSLVDVLEIPREVADEIGDEVGTWPLFQDSKPALAALMATAPCAALTNSDRVHGEEVQRSLGRWLTHWVTAEQARCYKPNPAFWQFASKELGIPLNRAFWHVSAYADYDLEVARSLGLTTVFVRRPHCRPGRADIVVSDLAELAARVSL
jgi:2-haloacid dehalogenase